MVLPTRILIFAVVSAASLAGGLLLHAFTNNRCQRSPRSLLRACFSTSVLCSAVALALFEDYLANPY